MQNKYLPAFPDPMRGGEQSILNQHPHEEPVGLTKREIFSAMAMQGLLVNANPHTDFSNVAVNAVLCADYLLEALQNI